MTETHFSLTLGSIAEGWVAGTNVPPEYLYSDKQLREEIEVLRGTKDDPKHRVNLAAYGVATGKWTGDHAYKNARAEINRAWELKKSGQCDGSGCKNHRSMQHILCHMDAKVVESVHPGNGLVSHFILR